MSAKLETINLFRPTLGLWTKPTDPALTWPLGPGWQKLCEGTQGLRRKVWTGTKILSPNIRYFVGMLRFVVIYTLFGNLWAKQKLFFGQKQCFLDKKYTVSLNILHIILNKMSGFVITRKNDAFVAKIVNMRLTKICMPIFAHAERLQTSTILPRTETSKVKDDVSSWKVRVQLPKLILRPPPSLLSAFNRLSK